MLKRKVTKEKSTTKANRKLFLSHKPTPHGRKLPVRTFRGHQRSFLMLLILILNF